jgi:hypothetical protein
VELEVARKRVCDVVDKPRSTIHAREAAAVRDETGVVIAFPKRGPPTEISDERLLELIREVIDESPSRARATARSRPISDNEPH